jgi:hypothetical protein
VCYSKGAMRFNCVNRCVALISVEIAVQSGIWVVYNYVMRLADLGQLSKTSFAEV